jgi:hypothetical protein
MSKERQLIIGMYSSLCGDDIHWNHYNDGFTPPKLTPSKIQLLHSVAPNVGSNNIYLPAHSPIYTVLDLEL